MTDAPTDPPDSASPNSGRLEGRVHVLPVRVYYEDTDMSGLVYHARYLHFLERGRSDFLRCAGVAHTALLARPDPLVFAVRRMTLDFIAPARIDDALEVRSRFKDARGARFFAEQEIRRGGEALLAAEVEVACVTPEGRARRAPMDLLAALEPHLAPGAHQR